MYVTLAWSPHLPKDLASGAGREEALILFAKTMIPLIAQRLPVGKYQLLTFARCIV